MRYGLFDTVDQLWVGDDAGPKTYGAGDPIPRVTKSGWTVVQRIASDADALRFARCAAEAACFTVQWEPNRIRVIEMPDGPWRIVDEVEKTMTTLDWVIRKERGTIY